MGHLDCTVDYSKPLPKCREITLGYLCSSAIPITALKKKNIPHVRHGASWVSKGWRSLIKLIKARDKICGEYWESF